MFESTTRIDRVCFLIHPCCWAMSERPDSNYLATYGVLASEWYAARNHERVVNQRQKDFIESLGTTDALVIYPIGESEAMKDLIATAHRHLGARCVIVQCPVREPPSQLKGMASPIRRFLDDDEMEGRQAFWDVIPEKLRSEVEQEIRDACAVIGDDWEPGALKVVQGNRIYAEAIDEAFRNRGLTVDPEMVTAMAFGEGFEECAMTWKSMLPGYLGWRHAIENDFDLSVSGYPVLFDATFRQCIALDHDIRLFLWEKSHGLPLALFARARQRLADPRYVVHLPLGDEAVEVIDGREQVWPVVDSPLRAGGGVLRVPVMTGSRKYRRCDTCYLVGSSYTFDAFRKLLTGAAITVETD